MSPDAVRFGEDVNLTAELKKSGLSDMGISGPEIFWNEIVNPAWQEASTTTIGYREIIYRNIRKNMPASVSDNEIRTCAARFVGSYLKSSAIDRRWYPVLRELGKQLSVVTVIATDHYAEATGYIVGFLKKIGAEAISLKKAFEIFSYRGFVVVNSADTGVHKTDRLFWETVKKALELKIAKDVLIIDDFGFNETAGDGYADRQKVEKRQYETTDMIEKAFGAPVRVIPFIPERKDEESFGDLIADVSTKIRKYIV